MRGVIARWLVGLVISLFAGHWVTSLFLDGLRERLDRLRSRNAGAAWQGDAYVPAWITGLVERAFFTVAVGFNVSGAVVAMIAWTAAKMATDWNRLQGEREDPAGALTGLLGSLVSMFFALIGGLICRGTTSVIQ